jgi:glycosyltransferase involved in cell wall biosynthesis
MLKNSSKTLLIIVPAFNEEACLRETLQDLTQFKYPDFCVQVCLVDDGSTDRTFEIAQEFPIHILRLSVNLGVGAAMRCGFIYAKMNNFDFLVQVDADGQHRAEEISKLLIQSKSSDIVVGSRFLEENIYAMGFFRSTMRNLLRMLLFFGTGKHVHDPTSGFRLFNRFAIESLAQIYPTQYLEDSVLLLLLAHKSSLSISETSVLMHQRVAGRPSQKLSSLIRLALMVSLNIFLRLGKVKK